MILSEGLFGQLGCSNRDSMLNGKGMGKNKNVHTDVSIGLEVRVVSVAGIRYGETSRRLVSLWRKYPPIG